MHAHIHSQLGRHVSSHWHVWWAGGKKWKKQEHGNLAQSGISKSIISSEKQLLPSAPLCHPAVKNGDKRLNQNPNMSNETKLKHSTKSDCRQPKNIVCRWEAWGEVLILLYRKRRAMSHVSSRHQDKQNRVQTPSWEGRVWRHEHTHTEHKHSHTAGALSWEERKMQAPTH